MRVRTKPWVGCGTLGFVLLSSCTTASTSGAANGPSAAADAASAPGRATDQPAVTAPVIDAGSESETTTPMPDFSNDGGVASGLAARYPGDQGIEGDVDVIFADDFEDYRDAVELNERWDAVYQTQYVSISTDAENVYAGTQALQFTLPGQDEELSDATDKLVEPETDVLFLRYYSKFEPPYDVVGSSHNGSSISAHYFVDGNATPGVRANGTNKFLVNLENWRGEAETRSPGLMNLYVYHPAQRDDYGDHFFPNGEVMPNTSLPFDFGPDFVAREQFIPQLGRWYCYELMVKANTPGQSNGRLAFWIDGKLAGDFPNLRLRDTAALTIDRFGLSFHIKSNPNGESRKWYDNVVAARSYIGPMR
jgi:hypothetical protein